MDREHIFDVIREIISEKIGGEGPSNYGVKLSELGIDSIGVMALIVYLEEEFQIDILLEDVAEFDNINEEMAIEDIVQIVEKNIREVNN